MRVTEMVTSPDPGSLEQMLDARRALLAKAQSLLDNLADDDCEGRESVIVVDYMSIDTV